VKQDLHFVSSQELSVILDISEYTIKKLVQKNEIPCSYIENRQRFCIEVLLDIFVAMEKDMEITLEYVS
jgi:hypothetical protein